MSAGDAPDALAVPPTFDVLLLVVTVSAVSTSAPLIVATAAPTLAIAFWRNALATGVLVPWALLRQRAELLSLSRRERRLALLAGALLAGHFATWVPSLAFTSVASATALVATQPIWTALLARRSGHHVPARAWVGMTIAVVGVALITGVDFTVSARAVGGDLLALVGAMFAAGYVVAGGQVRRSVTTTTYTTVCYLTAAVLLLAACAIGRQQLAGYPANAWLKLAALTLGAQLLGHSVANVVLRTTSPTVVSLAILFEVPGASLIALLWLHQHPPVAAVPGVLLLLAGIAVVVTARTRRVEPSLPVE